jgi:dehydrogenase/reductase SDR family protein 7B
LNRIWITGASSGIGEALARRFAQQGCRLVLSSRRETELRRVADTCVGAQDVAIVPLDLNQPETMAEIAQRVGDVDVLVHNGGVSQRAEAKDTAFEVDDTIMRTNYLGPVALTKAVLPSMLARRKGHFVVVTSALGRFSVPDRSAYSASKHALHGFFNALRSESAKDGIAVTLAVPGFVQTNVSVNALTGEGTPFGKMELETQQGITADACAARIVLATQRGEREVFIGGMKERFALAISHLAPGLFARIIRRK